MDENNKNIEEKIIGHIINLRRRTNTKKNWQCFDKVVKKNINTVCKRLNTRWLISICDTYTDYGNPIESRNALIITVLINMEKLAQTHLAIYDKTLNKEKIKNMKKNPPFELWDGMTSFNLSHKKGDLTRNMFRRISKCLEPTPHLKNIFLTVLRRIEKNNDKTILGGLNKYHKKVFNY